MIRLLFSTLAFLTFVSVAFSEKIPCPSCSFKNSSEDRYCLECGSEIRPLSPEEQTLTSSKDKEKGMDAFMQAQEEFNHAQSITDEKQKKMHYEAAELHVSVAYSKGASFFDRADWKTLCEIKWKCESELSTLRKRLRTGEIRVPLTKVGNSFYVEVLLNGTTSQKMLLDTGCSDTLLPDSAAAALSLQLGMITMSKVADGRLVSSRKVVLSSIKLLNAEVKDMEAHVMSGVNDGLLGMSFLEHFKFQIDTKEMVLILLPK